MVDGGILQRRGDFGKVQVVFPDHLLALLELDTADVFTGGDLQVFLEQHRQVAGADVHLLGNEPNGEFLPDVCGDILLGVADDLVLTVDGVGALELGAGGGLNFPQQHQKEHGQLGHEHIRGIGIHPLLGAEHLLQKGDRLLGHSQLPAVQAGEVAAVQIKGDGHEPGSHADVGILHMPLIGGIDHGIPLVEQPVLAIGHGVQAALIHIGQLRHGVGFAGEQEALFLLLIKESVDTGYPQLAVNADAADDIGTDLLRLNLRGQSDSRLVFVYVQ